MSAQGWEKRSGRASGYVLAGGASRRFGRDKALAEIAGKSMLARIAELIRASGIADVAVVGDAEAYGGLGPACIKDSWPGEGPLGGIITALRNTGKSGPPGGSLRDWNLILSCDMPFLSANWLGFLVERAMKSEAKVVVPHSEHGPEPLCACWRTDAVGTLQTAFESGVRRVNQGISLLPAEVLDERDWKRFDNSGRLFWNMNTAADYEEARRIIEAEQH